MEVGISEKTASKIKKKHGLFWDEVETIFDDEAARVELRTGDTHVILGRTAAGLMIVVFMIQKENVRWVKTARPMTDKEKRTFRKELR